MWSGGPYVFDFWRSSVVVSSTLRNMLRIFESVWIHSHPEVDRIWGILGKYSGSFKDHIFYLLQDGSSSINL